MSFDVDDAKENTIIELPYFYYLGYQVTLTKEDGTSKKIKTTESQNGFVQIILENNDNGKINVEYHATTIEIISYIISIISLICFIIYIIIEKRSLNEKLDKKIST